MLSSRVFNSLHNILQNSLAYFVYPAAKTSRFVHSIGVMHIASEIFKYGCTNAKSETLSNFIEELEKLVTKQVEYVIEKDPPKGDPTLKEKYMKNDNWKNKFEEILSNEVALNVYTPSSLKKEQKLFYQIALQALRISALLHDVGHLPFSHVSEYVLEKLWDNFQSKKESKENLNPVESYLHRIIDKYITKTNEIPKRKIHEIISLDVVDFIFCNEIIPNITETSDLLLLKVLYQLTRSILDKEKNDDFIIVAIRGIISSDLDADRIDFVLRDGKISGLLGSTGNIDRIIKYFTLVEVENKSYKFLPTIQTLNDLEQLIVDRFIIYKYLVCHHKVIRFDYLLEKAIELLINIEIEKLKEKLIKELEEKLNKEIDNNEVKKMIDVLNEGYDPNTMIDPNIKNLIKEIEGLIKDKLDRINVGTDILQMIDVLNKNYDLNRRMYRFFQIDDHWIINILRGKYFEILVKNDDRKKEESDLLFFLEELFTHSRKLNSLWKRDYEYRDFIKDFISDKKMIIEDIFKDLKNYLTKII